MDRKQALKAFGLPGSASRDEIARRYDVLQRKRRAAQMEGAASSQLEGMPTADEIEEAYRILADIAYKDPVAEKRLRERNAHPGLVARLLKMEQNKLDNLVHYYKWPVAVSLAALGLVIWFIVSTVFRPEDDFKLLVAGNIYIEDVEVFEQAVVSLLPGTLHPMVQNIYLGESTDAQMQAAIAQKLIVEIGYGENDVLLVDRTLFEQYAMQGAFLPLDDRLAEFGTTPELQQKQNVAILPDARAEGEDAGAHVYGIDVTGSALLKEAGVFGTDMIAVFGLNQGFPEKGDIVMKELMK